ncbi:unnamed protein product [Paramecium primaurelia]|uniref:Transmembrane protein n=1 Tax=Paramecium primaurelia TaxID=5886 RepID=A0A8S1JSM9_PARPR|nr:unnamed protein product [Paramecium primaurelia]
MDIVRWGLYGNIYTETYEHFSDGGPKCYQDMTNTFRISISTISAIICIIVMKKCWAKIKYSQELTRAIGKKPNIFEYLVGLACWGTFAVQTGYKLYTGRGVFMNNPCHIVLLMQGYVLLTKKHKFSAIVFICQLRWLYGVFAALKFPVITGLELPLEVEFFWIEHLLGAFAGPLVLTLSGRFFFFEWKTFFIHQMFGWESHVLYQRIYMLPISLMTWANLNFMLCRPDHDPFVPYIGNWYYVFSEFYLNLVSIMAFVIVFILTWVLRKIIRYKEKQD